MAMTPWFSERSVASLSGVQSSTNKRGSRGNVLHGFQRLCQIRLELRPPRKIVFLPYGSPETLRSCFQSLAARGCLIDERASPLYE